MGRVAIVIVTFNSSPQIAACLDAVASLSDIEIIVVDNASSDDTCAITAAYSQVRLIANSENRGFGAAVNQGVASSEAALVLLLNPDTRDIQGVQNLAALFSEPQVGAAGGLLRNSDGSPQTGFMYRRLPTPAALILEVTGINGLWKSNPVNWHYRCLGDDPMVSCEAEQPAGAFLMFSREAWRTAGGFSERFHPIWFEDVDFCARLKSLGYRVRYDPSARATHEGAHSIRRLDVEKRERYWYGSLLEYAAIHYGPFSYRAVCFAVASGALFRGVRSLPRSGFKALAVYGAVCRLALSRLFRPRRGSGCSVVCP